MDDLVALDSIDHISSDPKTLDLGKKDIPMPAEAESGESFTSLMSPLALAKIGFFSSPCGGADSGQRSDETLFYNYGFVESCGACSPNFVFATQCFQKTRILQRPRPKSRMKLNLHLTAETRRMMNN